MTGRWFCILGNSAFEALVAGLLLSPSQNDFWKLFFFLSPLPLYFGGNGSKRWFGLLFLLLHVYLPYFITFQCSDQGCVNGLPQVNWPGKGQSSQHAVQHQHKWKPNNNRGHRHTALPFTPQGTPRCSWRKRCPFSWSSNEWQAVLLEIPLTLPKETTQMKFSDPEHTEICSAWARFPSTVPQQRPGRRTKRATIIFVMSGGREVALLAADVGSKHLHTADEWFQHFGTKAFKKWIPNIGEEGRRWSRKAIPATENKGNSSAPVTTLESFSLNELSTPVANSDPPGAICLLLSCANKPIYIAAM